MIDALTEAAAAAGLAVRGGFHPDAADGAPAGTGTIVMLGWTGGAQWPVFAASAEAGDGRADPLDRWSRRVVGGLAAAFGGVALFPFGGPPHHPFQRWGRRAEGLEASPLGLLIHPTHGLWHAWRGALAFGERLALPVWSPLPSPCAGCADKPCLSACPVGAFASGGFDAASCRLHLAADADNCATACRARAACPVGRPYGEAQGRFHMDAFAGRRRG